VQSRQATIPFSQRIFDNQDITMSRASINTGSQHFGEEITPCSQTASPMRVAIIGDFSGRQNKKIHKPETITQRRHLRLTKDNFERVFSSLSIGLHLPSSDAQICFTEFDDLHPDFLYERLPLFSNLKKLQRQLLTTDQFKSAVSEIQQWATFKAERPILENNKESSEDYSFDNMLDAVLSSSNQQHRYQNSPDGKIDQLIKDIVSPYLSPKADPRQAEMLAAVNAAKSSAMRKILHHSDFQHLEASWRSLYFLIKRLEDNPQLELNIIDISKAELQADLQQADNELEQAQIFQALVANQATQGQDLYHLILGDFFINPDEADLNMLIDMSTIAQSANATFLCGAKESLAGCESLAESDNPENWIPSYDDSFPSSWNAIRDFEACKHTLLSAPRFMLRLPYSKMSSVIDSFEFEELPDQLNHEYYLWGNSAYLQLLLLMQSYNQHQWNLKLSQAHPIGDMPLHIKTEDNETTIKPCAEVLLSDRTAQELYDQGISVIRSVKNQDKIVIPTVNALAFNQILKGKWNSH
jgi:type VI secretion system protein ImpC